MSHNGQQCGWLQRTLDKNEIRSSKRKGLWKDFSTDTYEHRYIGVLPRIKPLQRATSEKYHFNNHVQHDLLFVSRKSLWKQRWSLCSTSDMNFHSPRPIWLRVDINTKLQTWHHFPRKPASHLVAGWLNWTIFITEETALVLTGGGEPFTCMVLPFTFLSFDISDKNHYHDIIYNITCDKKNSYYIKYWIYAHGSHWTVLFPSCRNSWPSKIVQWPLENSIMVPAGESIFRAGIVALCMIGFKSM